MFPSEPDHGMNRKRRSMNRRRFFRRCLAAGASGLLALFGPTADYSRQDDESSTRTGDFPESDRELAG